jgi:glycerol-3-phosphate dehydrogenase
VVLNARDADRGARILTRARSCRPARDGDLWQRDAARRDGGERTATAPRPGQRRRPWVGEVIQARWASTPRAVRLVRGSHIVTRKLFDHDRCYFFQGSDGRIVFAIPYETDFTLIGTTDQEHTGDPAAAVCTEAERDYLLRLRQPVFRAARDPRRCGLDLFRRAPAL